MERTWGIYIAWRAAAGVAKGNLKADGQLKRFLR